MKTYNVGMPELPQNTVMEDVEWFGLVESIIEYYNKNKGEDNFCLISFFNTLSTRLEIAADDFQKQDPDPIDMRHPVYLAPSCEYGTILRGFEKHLDFMTTVTTEYVKDNTCKSFDGEDITVAESTCRFLLVAYPAIDILLDNEETMASLCETLYSYALRNVNPLTTYALGILSKHAEIMVLCPKLNKADENTTLVNSSLQELWKLTTDGEPQRTAMPAQQQASSSTKINASMTNNASANALKQQLEVVSLVGKKRKRSSISVSSFPSSSDDQRKCKVRKHETSNFEISMPSVNDMPEANFSSSSWKEMRPIVVGSQYSLKPPLNKQVRQLHLLNYLAPLAEYQDVLSLFIKHNALGLVLWYLERSSTNNGLITYASMKLLAGLLCHQKITLVFIERKGIDKLLKVPRPSIGATGGGLILYYLSYHKEAMMLMAGLEKKVVSEMTKFAMWLLESSHDSGRCHAALFLLYAFPYQPFLKMFDSRNGLRYLVNMISTLPIMNGEENDDDEVAEERNNFHSYRQVTKTACTTLKKYLETHLKLEVGAVTARMNKGEWPFDPTKSVEIGGRSEMLSHIDFLRFASHDKRGKPFDTPTQPWQVAKSFLKLDGVRLLMKVLAIARRWSCPNQVEVVRYTLDCLAIVTLSSAAWPQLLGKMPDSRDFDPSNDDDDDDEDESVAENGLHTILRLSQGDDNMSGNTEPQRSALAVLVNCVCSPHLMKPRKEGQKSSGGGGGGCSSGGSCSNPTSDGNTSTPTLTSNKPSIEESLRQAWMFIKTHNGIHSLLDLLDHKSLQTSVDVDEFRLLACQALCGLSCCPSIRQVLSKLPFFNSSELLTLAQKPVLQSNQQEHTRFRTYMLMLVERVWGKPSKLNVDLESQRKDHIVTRTPIRFNNNELLRVIHDHLMWSGLTESANKLAQEASLPVKQHPVVDYSLMSNNDKLSNSSSPSSSISAHIHRSGSCEDGPSRNKISFTRGSVAQGKLPLLDKNIGKKQMRSWLSVAGGSGSSRSKFKMPKRKGAFSLSGNGTISTSDSLVSSAAAAAAAASTSDTANPSGVGLKHSLNHIITDYLRTQHSKCANPVVTVPEFSLFKKHRCPVPRHRLDAPRNAAQRHLHRQIYPRYGGLFGQQYDRQLIFGKMRPCTTFHDESMSYQGGANLYYSCCFSADESKIYIGNWRGDVIVRGLHGSNDANVMQVMDLNIVDISCSNDGQFMLCHGNNSEPYTEENRHELFALDPFASRIYFDDLRHMEFSKVQQDRLVGTDRSVAKIFDLNTGTVVTELAKDSWSSHYDDNRATFSYDDNLVLSDGILWDVRCSSAKPIHKFDKFNPKHSGIFHPQNLEVVINSEVWDLRSYHLLHTVPALDGKRVKFNHDGSAIYAAKWFDEERTSSTPPSTTLTVIDGHNYNTFNVIDTRSELSNFACDKRNYYFATIEGRNVRRFCRLYEIGRTKEIGEDDDNDSEGEASLDQDGPYRPGLDDDDDDDDDDTTSSEFDDDDDDDFSVVFGDDDDDDDNSDDDNMLRDIEGELNDEDLDFSETDMAELEGEDDDDDEDFALEGLVVPEYINFDNSDDEDDIS